MFINLHISLITKRFFRIFDRHRDKTVTFSELLQDINNFSNKIVDVIRKSHEFSFKIVQVNTTVVWIRLIFLRMLGLWRQSIPADTRWRHDLPPSCCWVHLPIFYALWGVQYSRAGNIYAMYRPYTALLSMNVAHIWCVKFQRTSSNEQVRLYPRMPVYHGIIDGTSS